MDLLRRHASWKTASGCQTQAYRPAAQHSPNGRLDPPARTKIFQVSLPALPSAANKLPRRLTCPSSPTRAAGTGRDKPSCWQRSAGRKATKMSRRADHRTPTDIRKNGCTIAFWHRSRLDDQERGRAVQKSGQAGDNSDRPGRLSWDRIGIFVTVGISYDDLSTLLSHSIRQTHRSNVFFTFYRK